MLNTNEKLAALLNSRLVKEQFGKHPKELYEPIRYILSIGGKRTRPLLTLLGYKLFNDNIENAIDPAMAVEIFHNFTLMHDDIMDQAPLRRGKATVHEKWDQHTAILSGDVMLVKAYEKLLGINPAILPQVIQKFNACAVEVCEGQQKDMLFEERKSVSEEEYIDMIRQKTAVLLGFALELGTMVANADEDDQLHIRKFGEAIGIGFQLKDDLLDVYGDARKFGKKTGGDILANKKTYLLIKALEVAGKKDKSNLKSWLKDKGTRPKEKISAVREIYDNTGIPEITNQRIKDYYSEALKHLNSVKAPLNRKKQLKQLALQLVEREK